MESLFELLFKYRPVVFERGDFTLGVSWGVYLAAVAGLALAVPTLLLYRKAKGRSKPIDRTMLSALRTLLLAVILFALLRPVLVLSTVVPQKNFLGILLDDSRSMRIRDMEGKSRGDVLGELFGTEDSALLKALEEQFVLRFFRFSAETQRIDAIHELGLSGTKTSLAPALDRVRQELASVPLAGMVLVSDGADNSFSSMEEILLDLRARSVRVYTVGLGKARFPRDIELSRIETPSRVLQGASLVVDVTVTQTGYTGSTVELIVEDGERIVNTKTIELPPEDEVATIRVPFKATDAGPRLFRFHLAPLDGELVVENNQQEALIVVEDRAAKILYVEGEPRFEIGKLRAALGDDENLRVVALIRTADNKYYRINIEDPEEELVSGFPTTREELFSYRGLILGSVEASFFTLDQLRMIADFAGQRGGGVLFLGGRRAFAEGGYANTPVADVLPIVLDPSTASETFLAEIQVELAQAGQAHPITQIAGTIEESAEKWQTLPPLTAVNRVTETKPGATTLLTGSLGRSGPPQIVLAHQRYGRGRVLVLPVQDSWHWQMSMPLEDTTHETFWRQLLRWMVSSVPDRVRVSAAADRVAPGESVDLLAEVEDDTYLKVNNTQVIAQITSPLGVADTIPMDWTIDRDGEYHAAFVPLVDGIYSIGVSARENGEFVGGQTTYVRVKDPDREYFGAEMQEVGLRRIAEETGGRFYTPETTGTLPEDISYTESGITLVEQRELWNMPIIFLLLMMLLSAEWGYRRYRGLA